MPFNDREYTEDALIKQLVLVELHSKDGSAVDAGCTCVEGKHLFAIEGLAEEGKGFALTEKEKAFYDDLANIVRRKRQAIEQQEWGDVGNPGHRSFLPHGLTHEEQSSKSLRHALSICIKQAEITCCGGHTKHYESCSCNPVAVCRASVEH